MRTLIIPGRMAGLNELISAERTHRKMGAKLKKDSETIVRWAIKQQLRVYKPRPPVFLSYHYYEPNKRRDKDNVSGFAHKIVQDSLVKEGILYNDGWDYVQGFEDRFSVDKSNMRIEVTIYEKGEYDAKRRTV